jgi:diguanylate cyclase (GGDEF)-like protein/PAS domain S-box-containing protein
VKQRLLALLIPLVLNLAAALLLLAADRLAEYFFSLAVGRFGTVWPATGVGLGAVVLGGPRVLPGVVIGCLLANMGLFQGDHFTVPLAEPFWLTALVTAGQIAEIALGAWWLRRTDPTLPELLERRQLLAVFLGAVPVMAALAATVAVPAMFAFHLVPGTSLPAVWALWWLGEAVGILVVLPLILLFLARGGDLWQRRRIGVLLPIATLLASVMAFSAYVVRQEQNQDRLAFVAEARDLNAAIQGQMDRHAEFLRLLGHRTEELGVARLLTTRQISTMERQGEPRTLALGWLEGMDSSDPGLVRLRGAEPRTAATDLAALPFATDPGLRAAIQRAASGHLGAISPRTVSLAGKPQEVLILIQPLARGGLTDTEGDPGERHGYLVALVEVDSLVEPAIAAARGRSLEIRLADRAEPGQEAGHVFYQRGCDCAASHPFPALPSLLATGLLTLGGHHFHSHIAPSPLAAEAGLERKVLFVLISAFLIMSLAGTMLLVVAGNAVMGEEQVVAQASHLRALNSRLVDDIIGRRKVERDLRTLSEAVEHCGTMVIIYAADGRIAYVNPKFTEIMGFEAREVLGQDVDLLRDPETPIEVYDQMDATLEAGLAFQGELCLRRSSGEGIWVRQYVSAIRAEDGAITRFVAIGEDITAERERAEQLSFQATHDLLTRLPNRREFERRVDHLIRSAQVEGSDHVLGFLDLDHFKVVNDTVGHQAGDELLRQIATLFRESLRKRDTLARLGGDEFAILLDSCSVVEAQQVAEELRAALARYEFHWEGRTFRVGVSIGLAEITAESGGRVAVLERADAACYAAKHAGRNRIELAKGTGQGDGHAEEWEREIDRAVTEGRFQLYFQVIVPLAGSRGAAIPLEVLLRMRNERGELVPPEAFLPAARRYGAMSRLDRYVVEHSIAWLARAPHEGVECLCVNLSEEAVADPEFLPAVARLCATAGIRPELLLFEIREEEALCNLTATIEFVRQGREAGFRFALDQMGGGASSFSVLRKLPVHLLKLDGALIRELAREPVARAVVQAIQIVAAALGLPCVAMHVEGETQRATLAAMGIAYGQGYLFGGPVAEPVLPSGGSL